MGPGGRSFRQSFLVGDVKEEMTFLGSNYVSLGEALCTKDIVLADYALSSGRFLVTLNADALGIVVVLAKSF